MMTNRTPLALAMATALLLGACADVSTYSDAEAQKRLTVDSSITRYDLRFAPGSATLSAHDAAQLAQLAASGSIGRADRVTVAVAGASFLAEQRIGSVAATLLHYGIVVSPSQLAAIPPNHGVVEVNRSLVTLPACPNWSKPTGGGADYGNQPSSNFGCETETNLGLMVAYPSDLASGRTVVAGAEGQPASSAMHRYLTDKVELPSANNALPIAQTNSTTPAATPGSQ
jgi:pilus assembly protein CpaD